MSENAGSSGTNLTGDKGITRRQLLGRIWWLAAGVLAFETTAGLVVSLWPRLKAGAFGTMITVATVEEARAMPVGTVAYFIEQRFYLSRVEDGFLALYRKCTHVGCVVPWLPDDPSEDSLAGKGRFNCPCHGGIFDRYGLVHAGPPLRPLDLFPITVEDGNLVVDTGTIITRSGFDQSQVVKV